MDDDNTSKLMSMFPDPLSLIDPAVSLDEVLNAKTIGEVACARL